MVDVLAQLDSAVQPWFALVVLRAQWLLLALASGAVIGELVARFRPIETIAQTISTRIEWLGRKLDRAHRSAATRVYRGMITLGLLLSMSLLAGFALTQPGAWAQGVSLALLITLFGRALSSITLVQLGRMAARRQLTLELAHTDYLFADTHAVLRYRITRNAEQFAVGIVGFGFWYVMAGLPVALSYLMLATAHRHYSGMAFGWAARALFGLVNAIPHLMSILLLFLAGIFTPFAHPFAARRAHRFHGFIAHVLGIALGGPEPKRVLAWEGTGTAKLEAAHLRRWLLLRSVAFLLLILALAGLLTLHSTHP